MKRHAALVPLSREHHGGLILSRLIQKDAPLYKGLPTDLQGKAEYAVKFYRDELIQHFEHEEMMLPFLKDIDQHLDQLLDNMVNEHKTLHILFSELLDQPDLLPKLNALGQLLEKHIRAEERELFPLIQEIVDDETLTKVQHLLT